VADGGAARGCVGSGGSGGGLVPGRRAVNVPLARGCDHHGQRAEWTNPRLVAVPDHRRTAKAYEGLIAEETQAAEQATIGSLPGRPGFVDGAMATLAWAWRRSGVPPIEVPKQLAG